MATITLEYDGRNALVKKLIEAMKLSGAKVVDSTAAPRRRKTGLERALDDVKAGRVTTYASTEDMFKSVLGKSYVHDKHHQAVR